MKKTVSLLLSFVMLISIVTGLNLTAFAESSGDNGYSIEFIPADGKVIEVDYKDRTLLLDCDEHGDVIGEFYGFTFNDVVFQNGNQIVLHFPDGTTRIYVINEKGQVFDMDDSTGLDPSGNRYDFRYWFSVSTNQSSKNLWTPGHEYALDIILVNTMDGTPMAKQSVPVKVVGVCRNGWEKTNGTWYYYINEEVVKGWKKISGKWYFLDRATGAMKTGWLKDGGKWYYLNKSGAMVTGWQKISNKWYYFYSSGAKSGAMVTGWQKISNKWYYFNKGGDMVTGWKKISGKWYYLESSGAMRTANLKQGGKTYRFNKSGACINP